MQTTIKDLTMKRILVDEAKEAITVDLNKFPNFHTDLLHSFVTISGKKCHIKNGSITYLTGKDTAVAPLIQTLVKRDTNGQIHLSKDECSYIYNVFLPLNTYDEIEKKINLLADADHTYFNDETITVVKSGFAKGKLLPHDKINWDDYQSFVHDYKLHFPHLDKMLDMITYNKVAPIKKSFLYIPVPSDFGKSILLASLEESGVGVEVKDIGNFIKKSDSSSVSVNKIASSACILFDEFRHFIDELLNITFHIHLAEKYKMSQKVDLGLKIMLSANMSSDLIGGIDEQILNRVMVFRDIKPALFVDIPTVKKIGTHKAREYLAVYIRDYCDTLVDTLREMKKPVLHCEQQLSNLGKEFDIRNGEDIETLDDAILNTLADALDDVNYIDTHVHNIDGKWLFRTPKKTIERLLKTQLDDSKVKHFMLYMDNFLAQNPNITKKKSGFWDKVQQKSRKGVLINLN